MNPILLQKQLKDNANDLEEFCKDLKSWGEEMKRKEDSTKKEDTNIKKVKIQKETVHKTQKNIMSKGPTDYSKWDKFDADLECQLLEEDVKDDSELTDEFEESKRDEALVHKEKGNSYVKSKEWTKAIEYYSKAIKCYSYDPVFYANRALCYLKINKFDDAEADCTLSLKLDKTYVKALQRRAAAREKLGELELAECDLESVLSYEPKNKESIAALQNIRQKMGDKAKKLIESQRPISKFTASRNKLHNIPPASNSSNKIVQDEGTKKVDTSIPVASLWPEPGCDITLVKTINKPPHLRSKKPLKRIEIAEINDVPIKSEPIQLVNTDPVKKHVVENIEIDKIKGEQTLNEKNDKISTAWPNANNNPNFIKCDDLKVSEKKTLIENTPKDVKNTENLIKTKLENQVDINPDPNKEQFLCPNNSVQFYNTWKDLKSSEDKFNYLKCIDANKIPNIFKESLESNVFSGILDVLSMDFIRNNEDVYGYLENLTKVKRFSALTMFMDTTDKNRLWKLITYLREQKTKLKEDVDKLIVKYEL